MSIERKDQINVEEICETAQQRDDIEYIIENIGGSYGQFQIFNYILYSIPICVSGIVVMTYVFTALNLDYRCIIPECDNLNHPEYNADWIGNVIPITNSKPSKCYRYKNLSPEPGYGTKFYFDHFGETNDNQYCSKDLFNQSNIVKCDEGGLVYKTNEISIVNAFNITCAENEWKLATVGTYNNIARSLFLPITGLISDRFGRKIMLFIGLSVASVAGLIQSFSINYKMFIVFEFLNAVTACGVYPSAFILGMEWAGVKHRVVVSSLIILPYGIGIMLTGVFAAYARDFRLLLQLAFIPGLIVAALVLCGSESLRWLFVKGKREEIMKILNRAASVNNRELSQKTIDIVNKKCVNALADASKTKTNEIDHQNSLKVLFTTKILIFRFVVSSLCWIAAIFITYGITIVSVTLNSDQYFTYIIAASGILPSGLLVIVMLKYIGRPKCTAISFVISGATILATKLVQDEHAVLAFILIFIGKCFSHVAIIVIYMHTTEIWPTPLRQSLMGLSSTIGRVGSILAPLLPLLAHINELIPFLSFGIVSIIAAGLVLLLPDTRNKTLPDTIDEAKHLGARDD